MASDTTVLDAKDAQTQYDNVEDRVEKFGTIIDKLGLESSGTLAPVALKAPEQNM